MAKKHKPKNGKGLEEVFSFRMSRAEWAVLERLANAESRTPSNMMRKLIADEAARRAPKR